MIGMFKGSQASMQRQNKGFVVLHHELLPLLKAFSGSEWLVLTCFALRADATGYSYPSISSVCEDTGLSERIVRQVVKALSTVTTERPYAVLRVEERHTESGRRSTNGYVILPDGFGEGAKIDRVEGAESAGEEGAKIDRVITLKNIKKEEDTPIVPKKGTKRDSVKMPVIDDPARLLYLAYRSVIFSDSHHLVDAFMLGEWRGAHHILRSMQGANVTPHQVTMATQNLLRSWGNEKSMVTLNALWKHWSIALSNDKPDLVTKTISQVERIWQD